MSVPLGADVLEPDAGVGSADRKGSRILAPEAWKRGMDSVKAKSLHARIYNLMKGKVLMDFYIIVSVQVLNEYYVSVTQKLKPGLSKEEAWGDLCSQHWIDARSATAPACSGRPGAIPSS